VRPPLWSVNITPVSDVSRTIVTSELLETEHSEENMVRATVVSE